MAIADDITSLEKKLIQLKTDYEQYFMGMQKTVPERLRAEVEKLVQFYSNQRLTNTALSFRFKTAVAKFHSYATYWDRIVREIEEGKYVRDIFKMKLHERKAPSMPLREPGKAPPEEDSLKKIYQEYMEARQSTNEPPVKFETVAELIQKQTPIILEKYKASAVDFKVVIEGGKAKLKAVPRK